MWHLDRASIRGLNALLTLAVLVLDISKLSFINIMSAAALALVSTRAFTDTMLAFSFIYAHHKDFFKNMHACNLEDLTQFHDTQRVN